MSFYRKLSEYYDVIFPLNQQSINFINGRIESGRLLDIAAGTGNHSIALAKLGHRVTATDLDANMVKRLSEKAALNNVSIHVQQLAMEQLDSFEEVDFSTIICLGNSLVHLDNLDEVKSFAANLYDLLTTSGKLIIQIVNYDRILSDNVTMLPFIHRETEKISFTRKYQKVDNKIIFKGVLTIGEEIFENQVPLLPITSKQLAEILTSTGFKSVAKYGSFKGESFTKESPALIIEAIK